MNPVLHHVESRAIRGLSLIELVVSLGVFGTVIGLFTVNIMRFYSLSNEVESFVEINEIRQRISNEVNCDTTLGATTPALNSFVVLRNAKGKSLMGDWGTGPFSTSRQFNGDWYAQSNWNGTSLEIRLAKKAKSSWTFDKDTLTKQPLNFTRPGINPVFGATTANSLPLCTKGTAAGYQLVTEPTTAEETFPLIDWEPNQMLPGGKLYGSSPLGPTRLCHLFCTKPDVNGVRKYRSGWLVGMGDARDYIQGGKWKGICLLGQPYPAICADPNIKCVPFNTCKPYLLETISTERVNKISSGWGQTEIGCSCVL